MLENIILSLKSILSHRLRSLLTMLGIIIGIAAIITIVSTIKGTNDQIKTNLIGAGTNVVRVTLNMTDGSYFDQDYMAADGVLPLTEEVRSSLDELDGVKESSLYVTRYMDQTYYQNQMINGQIYGVDGHYFSVCDYGVTLGRSFLDSDFSGRKKVAIVDTKVMELSFEGANPVGKTIEIKGEPFTVVGVVNVRKGTDVKINSLNDYYMYSDVSTGNVFIPVDCWPIIYKYDIPLSVAVKAATTDDMTVAGSNVADAVNEAVVTGNTLTYKADDILAQAGELQAISESTNTQLIWIAGISLLVGGIGVMNIMLVSVTERSREIGLKKAIGAKRRRILEQFLTEAGVLTSIGGIIGVAVGIGLSQMLSGVLGTPVSVSAPACIIAVVFSMVIGIVFGLIPAMKASKLNPIDALRRE